MPPQPGAGLSMLPRNSQGRQAPAANGVTEQPTIKQPSFSGPNAFHNALPQTPAGYVQGQQGRYGPGPMPPNGPANGFQGSGGPGPVGSGFARPGFNAFNQANSGPSFSQNGSAAMLAAPPRPQPGPMPRPDGPPFPGRVSPSGKRKKKRRVPIWARVVLSFLAFLLILGAGGFWYYEANFAGVISNTVGQKVARARGEDDPNANLTNGILTGPRVNILLLGSDTDEKFQGNYIAQTDIVVTIDPSSKTVGMLSIPRDFYINVPGYGLHKLDEAYGLGGVALSRRTIEEDFGIPINYYAWVGLDGFIKVIDTVGGVDVDVLHPITDGQYPDDVGANANDPYAFKRLYLSPGPQHLDGPTALEYVRSRHADLIGDFGRSARQQQVLTALKARLDNPSIFGELPQIAKDLNGFVKTDMELPDVLKLMNFARGLNTTQISKLTLGPPYSHSGTSPSGAAIVVPECDKIVPAIAQFLQIGNHAACNIGYTGDPQPLATATPSGNQPAPLSTPGVPGTNAQPTPDVNAQPTPTSTPDVNVQPTPTSTPDANAQPIPTSTPDANAQPTPTTGIQDWGNMGNMIGNTASGLGSGPGDLFGVRSLLDLLMLGVFESPDAFQM